MCKGLKSIFSTWALMVQSGISPIDSFVNIVYSVSMLLNVRGKISCGWSFTLNVHSLELALFPGSPPEWRRLSPWTATTFCHRHLGGEPGNEASLEYAGVWKLCRQFVWTSYLQNTISQLSTQCSNRTEIDCNMPGQVWVDLSPHNLGKKPALVGEFL